MRGRTNYTGGAKPVLNAELVTCTVAPGATVNKGDFLELYGEYKISGLLGFGTSLIKSAKLGNNLFVLAVRASTNEWSVRIVDTSNGDIDLKAMYSVTLGNGYTSSAEVSIVALEDGRFALFGPRADGYLGVTLQLYKYEDESITRLATEYFYSQGSTNSNPAHAPVCAITGKRLVVMWYSYLYHRVYSYADDTLTKLNTSEYVSGANSYIEDNMYLTVPETDFFIGLSKSGTYMSLQKVVSNDEIKYWTRTSLPENSYLPSSNNVIFVDEHNVLLVVSYKGSGTYNYEANHMMLIDTKNMGVVASTPAHQLSGMPSDRGRRVFGAIAPLGDGYFVMFEGKSTDNSTTPAGNVNYISYGRATAEQGIKILDCVEVLVQSQFSFMGQGTIFADEDRNCFYVENYSLDAKVYNTSYIKFHIANDKIIMKSDTLYAKKFSSRFDGVADSSGTSGEKINVFVPAGYTPPELTK